MRIGIFGGSFDPVHRGHIRLAEKILKSHSLNLIYFVPVARSPFKRARPAASGKDRLAMLRAAIRGKGRFRISDCELKRPALSYTIDTVKFFQRKFPGSDLFLLMGKDALRNFKKWRSWRKILKQTGQISHGRLGGISSTKIRARLRKGQAAGAWVPPGVENYIRNRRLYAPLSSKSRGPG